jgi:hypothetical protein
MAISHSGKAERIILARVFFITDANQTDFEKAEDGRQDFVPGQTGQAQISLDATADFGQSPGEGEQTGVFRLITDFTPARMIPVLFAMAIVSASGLNHSHRRKSKPLSKRAALPAI